MDVICQHCNKQCSGGLFCNRCGKALVNATDEDYIEDGLEKLSICANQAEQSDVQPQIQDQSIGSVQEKINMFEKRIFSRERSDDINLVLLGKSGVGKSTWINSFVNFLKHNSFEKAQGDGPIYSPVFTQFRHQEELSDEDDLTKRWVTLTAGVPENLCEKYAAGNTSASATYMPMCHRVEPRNQAYCINLIDTPGVRSTSGTVDLDEEKSMEVTDEENMNAILNSISQYKYINAFIILLKPGEQKLDHAFIYSLKMLFSQFHESAKSNVIFAFTHANNCQFVDTDTIYVLHKYLHEIGLEIKIQNSNVFYFDSIPFRYLIAYRYGYIPREDYEIAKYCWRRSLESCENLIQYVDEKLMPHEMISTISVYDAKWMITCVLKPLVQICKLNEENIANVRKAFEELANSSGRTVMKNIKDKVLIFKMLENPMTVCTNQKCCKQELVFEGGCNVEKNIYDPICCEKCYIPFVSNKEPGSFTLYLCNSMHFGKCNVCKHHKNEHMHVTYELYEAEKLYKMEVKDLKEKMDQLITEMNIIVATLAFFSQYLKKHSLLQEVDQISVHIENEIKNANEKLGAAVQRQADIQVILKDKDVIDKTALSVLLDEKWMEYEKICLSKKELRKLQRLRRKEAEAKQNYDEFERREELKEMERNLRIDMCKAKTISEADYQNCLEILEISIKEDIDEKKKDISILEDLEELHKSVEETTLLIHGLIRIRKIYNGHLAIEIQNDKLTPKCVNQKINHLCKLKHNGRTFNKIYTNIMDVRKNFKTKKQNVLQLVKEEIPKLFQKPHHRRAIEN